MTNNPQLPLVADVDIVVVGSSSAAVSFALSAQAKGASVYVLAARPFLGDDICDLYRYWPEGRTENALAREIFGDGGQPPRPMKVKLTLEQRLVAAGIPFLFNCFPAGLLRTEGGAVQGVALANRTGLQAIRSRVVVDATLDALVLKQAGYPGIRKIEGRREVEYVTFCEGEGSDAAGVGAVERLPGYEAEDYAVSARRYTVPVDFGDGSPVALAAAYGDLVDRCWVPQEYRHQTRILPRLAKTGSEPTPEDLQVEPGLWGMSESMLLPDGEESIFANPIDAIRFAENLGARVASAIPGRGEGPLAVSCAGSEPVPGELRTLSDALRPGKRESEGVTFDSSALPRLGRFDVVVAGGGTGGAPAAISASRAGAETLVVELTSGLGGVGTMGQISQYWYGNRVGFTAEIDRGVKDLEYRDYFKEREESWSVAAKSAWYHQTGRREGCTYWFNTLCAGVCVEGDRVTAILVAGPYGYGLVEAGCVVDSTGCSDIPAIAGAPTIVIGKDHLAVQGTGLAGLKPGRDYHNSDHNFSDDTDVVDATAMLTTAKLKFKNDFDCGELIDSRERRQIIGDYAINAVDILYERRFPDTICVASSNFDSHGFTIDPVFMLHPPEKKDRLWADIPLRCLLPQGLDGVLVTGLGLSAHRDALPVIRMQADVQNQGYAAGYIAALSARNRKAVRELSVLEIQEHLVGIGGLPDRVLSDEDSFPVSEEQILKAVKEDWNTLPGVALILYEKRSIPFLLEAFERVRGTQSAQSICYAEMLAFHRRDEGKTELRLELDRSEWDEGWSFRGMHQFGMTLSDVDKLIICLGLVGDESSWPAILQKIRTMPAEAEFSHFRALAMGCEALYARHPLDAVAGELCRLLERPGYRGHAQPDILKAQASLTEDINENHVRELALREIHLARAILSCGDCDGEGEAVLQSYTHDCRGHFARHALSILGQYS